MAVTFKTTRGLKAQMPALADGQQYLCLDTNELFIGNAGANKLIVAAGEVRGNNPVFQDGLTVNGLARHNVPAIVPNTQMYTYEEWSRQIIDNSTNAASSFVSGAGFDYINRTYSTIYTEALEVYGLPCPLFSPAFLGVLCRSPIPIASSRTTSILNRARSLMALIADFRDENEYSNDDLDCYADFVLNHRDIYEEPLNDLTMQYFLEVIYIDDLWEHYCYQHGNVLALTKYPPLFGIHDGTKVIVAPGPVFTLDQFGYTVIDGSVIGASPPDTNFAFRNMSYGSERPTGDVGRDGDVYIIQRDSDSGNGGGMYIKDRGLWVQVMDDARGAQGPQGPKGDLGPQGAKGATGPQGPPGPENGVMTGSLVAGGTQDLQTAQVRNISAGTSDLTPGVSPLANGALYLVYE